jgi:NAD-dependent DNA ligase
LADGLVVQAEAEFLLKWMLANKTDCMEWPMNMLFGRLSAWLEDGVLDPSEETELMDLLMKFTGGGLPADELLESGLVVSVPSSLPLNSPEPRITFAGKSFCFTGEMCFGPRTSCEDLVKNLGGVIKTSISKQLDYLVVGEIGSLAWIHSTHGRKIEAAVEVRGQGHSLAIICEGHWLGEAKAVLRDIL